MAGISGNENDICSEPTAIAIIASPMELEVSTASDKSIKNAKGSPCCSINRVAKLSIVTLIIGVLVLALVLLSKSFQRSPVEKDNDESKNSEMPSASSIVKVKETRPQPPLLCSSEECALTAKYLLQSMDLTVNPCQDFYQFSCGGWENMLRDSPSHIIFGDTDQIDSFNLMDMGIKEDVLELVRKDYNDGNNAFKMARTVYQSCMNIDAIKEAGKTPLIQLFDSYGGWPIITPNWNESNFDWKKVSTSLFIQLGIQIFFEISTVIVSDDEDNTIISVSSSSTPDDDSFLNLQNLIIDHLPPDLTESEAFQSELKELCIFQEKLSNIPVLPEFDLRSITNLANFQKSTDPSRGVMNWAEHLNDIFSGLNITVFENERIIGDVSYLSQLFELLNETSPRVIANYIHSKIVDNTIEDTEEELTNLNRETFCFLKLQLIEPAIIPEYVKKFSLYDQRQEIKQLIGNLKSAFRDSFYDWETLRQIDSLKEIVGYPDWITNETLLNSYYQELKVSYESHFKNICNLKRFWTTKNLKSLRRKRNFDDQDELLLLTTPRAFYERFSNTVGLHLSFLRPPFYRKGGLMASNYGSLGFIAGQEIGKGTFIAKMMEAKKEAVGWLASKSFSREIPKVTKVVNQMECFFDQYNDYEVKEINEKLNGLNTLAGNMADNIGVTRAFRAYQNYVAVNGAEGRLPGLEQFSPEQVFFISFARNFCTKYADYEALNRTLQNDEYTIAPYRIIGALSNSYSFSEHFKCSTYRRMNRYKKCTVN